MKIKRKYSKIKKRDLFLKGDRVRYKPDNSHNSWYSEDIRMTVMENESTGEYSGVFVDSSNDKFMGEDYILYRNNKGDIKKAIIEYNFDLDESCEEITDSETKKKLIIKASDIVGKCIKEYIIELDKEYYIRKDREESIDELIS